MMDTSKLDDPLKTGTPSRLPLLAEIAFTYTKLFVIFIGILVMIISFFSKAAWYVVLLRTAVTLVVFSALGYGFNWYLGKRLVETRLEELLEDKAREEQEQMEREERERIEREEQDRLEHEEDERIERLTMEARAQLEREEEEMLERRRRMQIEMFGTSEEQEAEASNQDALNMNEKEEDQ